MIYATTNHIGHISNAQKQRATKKTAIQTDRGVLSMDAETKGRRRNQKGQKESRSDRYVADGFLKSACFLPRMEETETIQSFRNNAKMGRDFYTSLSTLAEHYRIQPVQPQSMSFPLNISQILKDVEEQLQSRVKGWEEIKLVQDCEKIYFTSQERYDTNTTLYYIPVIPLYRFLNQPTRRQTAMLLLSVYSYLYNIAGIPYYRNQSSYLYGIYDIQKDWLIEDDYIEIGEKSDSIRAFLKAECIGDIMRKKITNQKNLFFFQKRLDRFIINDDFDNECFKIAQEAYSLYQKYPNETLFRNARANGEIDEEEGLYVTEMGCYISFCADLKGWLMSNIFDYVNNELQEHSFMEEPTIIKRFDGNNIVNQNFDMEHRLFSLIDELTYVVNHF